ncbi:MAG: O-antigen ligase family protein [Candidatus Krumholzibacteriota bacterium]|nr:O-antigen ligase family protein [Candidatus Krumholzibacteriota bacterium]
MNEREHIAAPGRTTGRSRFRWLRPSAIVLGMGILVGSQIASPAKRVIEAIVGVVVVLVLWNFSTIGALWFLVVMYPFPFAISLGTSNFVFTIVIFLIHMIRVSAGQERFFLDKRVAAPVLFLVGTYILSLYNVLGVQPMLLQRSALLHTGNFIAAALFFFMIISFVDNEKALERTVKFMVVCSTLVVIFTVVEMLYPGRTLIPFWLYTRHRAQLIMRDIRMGGPFHDFELVAEFFAINILILLFMVVRARRMLWRGLYLFLLVSNLAMMLATITRGAFISLFIGLAYLTILSRRDLDIVRFVGIAAGFALLIVILETFVSQYTTSGSLFERLLKTTFERGVVPTNRMAAWSGAIERGMEHPFIGKGPGWDFASGLDKGLWPHNVYLFYFNITGIVGLAAFLFFLWRIFRMTTPAIHASIVTASFPVAFLKILHVCFVLFAVDQLKIEYLRNEKYVFFIWLLFAMIAATSNIVRKQERERNRSAPVLAPSSGGGPT